MRGLKKILKQACLLKIFLAPDWLALASHKIFFEEREKNFGPFVVYKNFLIACDEKIFINNEGSLCFL